MKHKTITMGKIRTGKIKTWNRTKELNNTQINNKEDEKQWKIKPQQWGK